MIVERETRTELAAMMVTGLEARGAVFTVDDGGYLRADLDAVRPDQLPHGLTPDLVAMIVLTLAPEIKSILASWQVFH